MAKKQKQSPDYQNESTQAETIDPIFLEILKGLLANPHIYNGRAENDGPIIKIATRLRGALVSEGLAQAASDAAKE